MTTRGFFSAFADVWMLEGVRTPMVDYCGALGHISPTDLGIKAARAVLARAGVAGDDIGSVVAGNMAPGDFDQFCLPRHIGLYAGVPVQVPAIMVQRICGTGFELFRQAGEQVQGGACDAALVVGTESMTRNPIASFEHRTGFKLGAPVGFKDFMWEALKDPAPGINMIETAENLARQYGITREEVDHFASESFAKAVAAQQSGFHAGEIVPVVTIVNGVNNEQVGRIIEFALDNPKRINFLSFQPVSFTGRDEEVTAERRAAQRYTLSHLAHDVKNQTGMGEPVRDWFPISFMGTFTDWADIARGPENEWGNLTCGCHPNCGVGMAIMIDKETKEAVPVTAFVRAERLASDVAEVNDAARGKFLTIAGMALALARNYDPFKAPTHFRLTDLLKKFDKTLGATGRDYGKVTGDRTMEDIEKRRADRWNFLFIAGMWFQDLFNYDFRRTEMCIIPYATQMGEISFCAYNTGIGWRNIIEKMHMTATLTKWYDEHGRHEIFAGNKSVPLGSAEHTLKLNAEAVATGIQTDLDDLGIAKNSRDEKIAAQKKKNMTPEELRHHAEMEALYRKEVLKEQPGVPVLQIQGLKKAQQPTTH